jgi:NAD(P)H-dependent FMN reductase
MANKLHVIVCSTQPGRVGLPVGEWFFTQAQNHGRFDAELIDLATIDLPMYDEPKHPSLQQYQREHTKRWSAKVASADAYIFVTPEYNFGPPPALVNALNYVYKEWNYKPAGFVSYRGISGGLRAVQMEKLILTTLKVVPLVEAVGHPDGRAASRRGRVPRQRNPNASGRRASDRTRPMGGSSKAVACVIAGRF